MADAWFYSRDLASGETVELDGREAKHASSARRLGEGDRVMLFDGRGGLAEATITEVNRRASHMTVLVHEIEHRKPLVPVLHLVCALPKGDRQSVLLNMATQLGMASFTPLLCDRSVVKPGRTFAERAERICIEACKQCHQPHCPEIRASASTASVLDVCAASEINCVMLDPGGDTASCEIAPPANQIAVVVGPEGGFTDAEVDAARRAGVQIITLGTMVLRIETAALAAMALYRFR